MENVVDIESVPLLLLEKSNLRAGCQRCHLRYDIAHHKRNSATTRHKKIIGRGQLELIPRNAGDRL
jgi:hypothetical protein